MNFKEILKKEIEEKNEVNKKEKNEFLFNKLSFIQPRINNKKINFNNK